MFEEIALNSATKDTLIKMLEFFEVVL